MSSHIGNDELAGYELKAPKNMNALVFDGEGKTLTENRSRVLGVNNVRLVNISEDMSHLVILNNALADGEIVNIHGDRVFGSNRTVRCNILESEVELPLGPFMLASTRAYAINISVMLLIYPDQWFNFYEFWKND